jgi:UDP-2-acetamido-2,6-beta-L-arabino-hexul-4-ose reductase
VGNNPAILVTSSTQAEEDNPYGISKRKAEEALFRYAERQSAKVYVYRLTNVFGKWCRPFYNSVIATFCHQVARDEPLRIDDSNKEIEFIYIDDVIRAFVAHVLPSAPEYAPNALLGISPVFRRSLGTIAALLKGYKELRSGAPLPCLDDPFTKYLYSTYLSYLPPESFSYSAEKKTDTRGYLFELIKAPGAGQIFVSRTKPGITRGNHYHDTKVEKFCVVEGLARVSLRELASSEVISFEIEGTEGRIVDIPPGWTHNITNIGQADLVTMFWSNEIFDPLTPDTFSMNV